MSPALSTLGLVKLYLGITGLAAAVIFGSPELTMGPSFMSLSVLDKLHVGTLFIIDLALFVGGAIWTCPGRVESVHANLARRTLR